MAELTLVRQSAFELVLQPPGEIVPVQPPPTLGAQQDLATVLSPTQVSAFLDCSARWWFKYGLALPEPKTSSLALGTAVHGALEVNFREKLETGEDLDILGVVAIFRDSWQDIAPETRFQPDEDPVEIGRIGERLVAKYMDEVAPLTHPVAVELDVAGEINGVKVHGRIDLVDTEGRIVDVKTAARRPTSVSPDYALQIATYRLILPVASGQARLDALVKTKAVQLVSIA